MKKSSNLIESRPKQAANRKSACVRICIIITEQKEQKMRERIKNAHTKRTRNSSTKPNREHTNKMTAGRNSSSAQCMCGDRKSSNE